MSKEIQKKKELASKTSNKVGEEDRKASPQFDTNIKWKEEN